MLLKLGSKYMQLPSPQNIEYQIVEVSTANGKLTIVNVYVPPTSDIDVSVYQTLFTRPHTIIVGDLNAKNKLWNSATENARGRAVETLVTQNNFVVLNTGQPTFENSRGQISHIDLTMVSSNLGSKCVWHTLNNTMGSDHLSVITEIGDQLYTEGETILKWRLDKADWKKYQDECRAHLEDHRAYDDDVDRYNHNVIEMIIKPLSAACQRSTVVGKENENRYHTGMKASNGPYMLEIAPETN